MTAGSQASHIHTGGMDANCRLKHSEPRPHLPASKRKETAESAYQECHSALMDFLKAPMSTLGISGLSKTLNQHAPTHQQHEQSLNSPGSQTHCPGRVGPTECLLKLWARCSTLQVLTLGGSKICRRWPWPGPGDRSTRRPRCQRAPLSIAASSARL